MSFGPPILFLTRTPIYRGFSTLVFLFALFQGYCLTAQELPIDQENKEDLVLPAWSKQDQKFYNTEKRRFPGLGGGLWPPEIYPLPALQRPMAPLAAFQVGYEDANADSQARYEEAAAKSNLRFPVVCLTASASIPGPPEELTLPQLDLYFGQKPSDLLIDPPRLLTETQKDDVERLLQHHERDSEIPIYVFVLDANQRMPHDFDLSKLVDSWFGSSSACILIVHLGAPPESRLMFTSSLRSKIGIHKMNQWLLECITSAKIASEPIDQVERFVAQNSLRIFWLEKMLHPLPVVNADEIKSQPGSIAAPLPAPTYLVVDDQVQSDMPWPSTALGIMVFTGLLATGLLKARLSKRRPGKLFAPPQPLSTVEPNACLAAQPHYSCGTSFLL